MIKRISNLASLLILILPFCYICIFDQFNPDKCPSHQRPQITIGILGLTFGPSTYKPYVRKLTKIIQEIENYIENHNQSILHSKTSSFISSLFKENDFIYHQNIDPNLDQSSPNVNVLLNSLKEHKLKFEKKRKYCWKRRPSRRISRFEGNEYLYYSTSYAKMLFGWNNFEDFIPSSEDLFQSTWNSLVRTVPIDYYIKRRRTSRRQLKKIISKLDGILFTGGNSTFYTGIDKKQFPKNSKYYQWTQEKLMRKYLRELNRKAMNEDEPDPEFQRRKSKYFKALSMIMDIVKERNRDPSINKKIPVLGICLGFEGLLLYEQSKNMRLEFVSDLNRYHDTMLLENKGRVLEKENDYSSFKTFVEKFYKNDEYFPVIERNSYYFHTKMINPAEFYKSQRLSSEYEIIAVSHVDDLGVKNKEFGDLGKYPDWIYPQRKTLVAYPLNGRNIERRIKKGRFIYFRRKSKTRRSDFRLQHRKDLALILQTVELVKEKLKTKIRKKLRANYTLFVEQATRYLDRKLKKNKKAFLKKQMNTDYFQRNNEFISIVEAKSDPIYGVQFHFEKSMYNFHKNQSVKNTEMSRIKDQLISKFFLHKVFESKYNSLVNTGTSNKCVDTSVSVFRKVLDTQFTKCKLVPHIQECIDQFGESKFNYDWLYKDITKKYDSKGRFRRDQYNMNTKYNNALTQQILRDFDEFLMELYPNKKKPGPDERFILRNIGLESEVLVFKHFKRIGKRSILDRVVKCQKDEFK